MQLKNIILVMLSLLLFVSEGEAQKKEKKQKKRPSLVGKEFTTESGLKYEILKEGTGERAKAGDIVSVHYTGKLTNDTVFDSSVKRGQPFKFRLGEGQVIPGWDEGVALLNVGDKAKFTIPSGLAYGEKAMGPIPANSTLIFEVELLDIVEPPKAFDVKGKDTVTLESGLRYIMVNEHPEGEQAETGKEVKVHYSGYLENGKMFDSSVERGSPFSFPLGEGRVIKGWDEGVALLKTGEKARFIIPHELAYGERGYPPVIPPRATLIFDVELLGVE